MQWLLFVVWALALCIVVWRSSFLKATGLKREFFVAVFLLYAAIGCLHVWIAYHYYPGNGDIWDFYTRSLKVRQWLLHDHHALRSFFWSNNAGSVWGQFQYQSMVMIYAVLDFVTLDNIYTNTLIFSSLGVWGKAALYQVFKDNFPEGRASNSLLAFFIPSVLFWSSPIHKEAIIYLCIAALLYGVNKWVRKGSSASMIAKIIIPVLVIFFIRKIVLLSLLPALISWIVAEKFPAKAKTLFMVFSGIFLLLLFLSISGPPKTNFLHLLANRQSEFMEFEGGSRVLLPALDGSLPSFLRTAPIALFNGLLMPLPGTGGKMIYSAFGVEMIGFLLLSAVGAYAALRGSALKFQGFGFFCVLFSITACFMVGCLVPFAGAIVRYRSIFLPFLFAPFLTGLCRYPRLAQLSARIQSRLEADNS